MSENSEKGSAARVRDHLHAGTTRYSNAQEVKKLRDGDISQSSIDSSEAALKREAYALSGLILGDIYEHGKERLYDAKGNALPQLSPAVDIANGPYMSIENLASADIFAALDTVRNSFALHMNKMILTWFETMNQPLDDRVEPTRQQKIFSRFTDVVANLEFARDNLYPTAGYRFLASGGGTAAHTSWDIIRAIPVCYHKHYSRPITKSEFLSLTQSSETLALELSTMHIQNFNSLGRFDPQTQEFTDEVEFTPDFFRVENGERGARLVFDEDTVRIWSETSETLRLETRRIGCPARETVVYGKDGEKTNLVSAAYRYNASLAEQFLAPNLEQYTKAVVGYSV